MMSRILIALAIALASLSVAVPATAQTSYDDITFTEVLSDDEGDDAAGLGGFYDLKSVSMGIDATGNLVVLTETAGVEAQDAQSSIEVSFTANGANYKLVFNPAGGHLGSSHSAFSDSGDCDVIGSKYYCTGLIDGDSTHIVLTDGDVVTGIEALSKFVAAEVGDAAEDGTDFTYGAAEAGPVEETLTDAEPTVSANYSEATTETIIYTWENTVGALDVGYAIEMTGGSVQLQAKQDNTTLIDETFSASAQGSVPLSDAANGTYTITLIYTDFIGTLDLTLSALSTGSGAGGGGTGSTGETAGDAGEAGEGATEGAGEGTAGAANKTTNAAVDDEKGLPIIGIAPVLAALGGIIGITRRRD